MTSGGDECGGVVAALPLALADVEAAARRIAPQAVRTPLLRCPALEALIGGEVFVKPECLQRTGSFKFRGAYNRLAMIPAGERARGVVACSSGNHAQGVAEAARLLDMPATIVMPTDAPPIKAARTRRAGASIVGYDRERDDRTAIAMAIVERTGATFVHPFDDPAVMAGQGTVGLEIAADLEILGATADAVLVPVSGGGLLAGVAVALADRMGGATCHPVEPEGFDDLTRSLQAGARQANSRRSGSLADALMSVEPGVCAFEVHRRLVAPGYAVPEEALLRAMAFAFAEMKIVVEPGGGIALAALLAGLVPARGRTVVAVVSGGNVEPSVFARALSAAGAV